MVLRGAEIVAAPRASPEILENTDLEAPSLGNLLEPLGTEVAEDSWKRPWGAEDRT